MGRKSTEGSWAILTPDNQIILENSELRALRKAVAMGAEVKFVPFGTAISDAPNYGDASSPTMTGVTPKGPLLPEGTD